MATTTNFGWETPDDTDLVKDGALAIRTLGSAIDTSLVDLKGGTTGQVLSKTSNTDMDFTWVTSDDANAIQNAIVDAKGDLIAASAADTPARLAVGNNGETLVADSSATTGLRWQGNFAAGKNKIINGDMNIWQRGTSFTNPGTGYTADRFWVARDGSGATGNITRESFTAGSAPVAGYESPFFYRYNQTVAGTGGTFSVVATFIEDVRTLAGQTVTFSFWAKAGATITLPSITFNQNFGSGGSADVDTTLASNVSITTSWTRYSYTVTMPSVSGKTIGSSSYVRPTIYLPLNSTFTFDTWGWQLEAGNTATAFQTATGTLAGEYLACGRYYQKSYDIGTTVPSNTTSTGLIFAPSGNVANNAGVAQFTLPVRMRIAPTVTIYSYTSSNTGRVSDNGGTDLGANSGLASRIGDAAFYVYNNSGGTITAASGGFAFHYAASAEL